MQVKIFLFRIFSIGLLGVIYCFTILISVLFRRKKNISLGNDSCILVIGTFHNPNWFLSHITPLTQTGLNKIIVVCDTPVVQLPKVQFACPPLLASKVLGRALSKFLWAIACGFRYKPELYMGYHIFPAAVSAQIVGKLFNKATCYQNTSGSVELAGGGWLAANPILNKLSKPSSSIEYLVAKVVCCFDLVVVRGTKAEVFVRQLGYEGKLEIITGSLAAHELECSFKKRRVDLIFVGRLSKTKRPEMIISIVGKIVKQYPELQLVIVGDGDKRYFLEQQVEKKNLKDNIRFYGQRNNVLSELVKSKVFILTSRSEGLSIAMIEAMSTGTVPVVSNVGDLGDIVKDGINGFLVDKNDIDAFCDCIINLICNEKIWEKCSAASIKDSYNYSSVNVIAQKWKNFFLNIPS